MPNDSWDCVERWILHFARPQLSTHKPYLQKVLPCRHPCCTWDLGLGTPCEPALTGVHGYEVESQEIIVLSLTTPPPTNLAGSSSGAFTLTSQCSRS